MILKRASDRYNQIKSDERRLAQMHGPSREQLAQNIQQQRLAMNCAELSQNLLDRAYGHNQTIGLLHDVPMGSTGENIDHLMIDAQTGEILVISTNHIGAIVKQQADNQWQATYGRNRLAVEDPRRRLHRHIDHVQKTIGPEANVIGIAVLPLDAQFHQQDHDQIHLVLSDHFEAFISNRRGGFNPTRPLRLTIERIHEIARKLGTSNSPGAESKKDENVIIHTPNGNIHIKLLPSGHYALRNDSNPQLIETVRRLIKGEGRWSPKYRNWIVPLKTVGKVKEYFSL